MRTRHANQIAILLCVIIAAASASAAPRDATLELLRAVSTGREDGSVRVFVIGGGSGEGGNGGPVRIGDELAYRFESRRPGYLTAIHVDTHGAATLFYPRAEADAGRIDSGLSVLLPAADDGFSLTAQPPVGRDVIYAIVTDTPISRRDLGVDSREVVVSFEPHQSPGLVRHLRDVLGSRPAGEVRITHVDQQVDGRGDVQYRSADIVGFFGQRTRSIRPPKLDLQIQFSIDSATLDAAARRNVDEFAQALQDPQLSDMRFKVSGHTDDQGSDGHNMDLSRRRAETVRRYLVDRGGVDDARLEVEALGESSPLMNEESEFARRMNRRVEFTPIR